MRSGGGGTKCVLFHWDGVKYCKKQSKPFLVTRDVIDEHHFQITSQLGWTTTDRLCEAKNEKAQKVFLSTYSPTDKTRIGGDFDHTIGARGPQFRKRGPPPTRIRVPSAGDSRTKALYAY